MSGGVLDTCINTGCRARSFQSAINLFIVSEQLKMNTEQDTVLFDLLGLCTILTLTRTLAHMATSARF